MSPWNQASTINSFCSETRSIYTIQQIILPNGTSWKFLYDVGSPYTDDSGTTYYTESYGSVKKIFTPTGGTISYTYANRYNDTLVAMSNYNARIVTSRTETDLSGNTSTRTYSYTTPVNGTMTSTETSSDRTVVHNFLADFAFTSTQQALETESRTYQGTISGTPIEQTDTTYNTTSTTSGISPILPVRVVTQKDGVVTSDVRKAYNSPFVLASYVCEAATVCSAGAPAGLINGAVSLYGPLTTYLDQVTEESVYDGSGNLLKTTQTTPEYMVNSNYFYNNQLHLVASQQVLDVSGTVKALTTYGYDDAGFYCPGTSGSQTSVNRWLDTANQYLTTLITYDCHGMPTIVRDPKGNTTVTTYDDTGLFPKQVQRPTTNGVQHVDYYTYDPNIASVKVHVDQNGSGISDAAHMTSYSYDIAGRLIQINRPPVANGTSETDICYSDLGGQFCSAGGAPYSIHTRTLLSTGVYQSPSSQTYDGFGRISKSIDPSGATVDTTYDAEGRVYSVSNPYYSTSDPTYAHTYYQYDAIGRKRLHIQPDGSTQSWAYSGNSITSTDEQGNQWLRVSDALGRLVQVFEPGGTNKAPSMETDYTYDALGNMLSATQWGGASGTSGAVTRVFTYDSLSRLLAAANPETGTVQYTYDADSNIYTKTDARGISTTYSVDQLNRLIGKSYSNGDPSVTYGYDSHSSSNFGIGFRTSMTDSSGSASWIFDAEGRTTSQTKTIGSISKNIGMLYYLNGAVEQLTYPSGVVLQYTLDSAGRNTAVADATNGIQYVQNAAYNAPGALTGDVLGYSTSFAGITESGVAP